MRLVRITLQLVLLLTITAPCFAQNSMDYMQSYNLGLATGNSIGTHGGFNGAAVAISGKSANNPAHSQSKESMAQTISEKMFNYKYFLAFIVSFLVGCALLVKYKPFNIFYALDGLVKKKTKFETSLHTQTLFKRWYLWELLEPLFQGLLAVKLLTLHK